MHTEITIDGNNFLHGIVEPLFTDLQIVATPYSTNSYSVSNDGERFLVDSEVTVDALDTILDQGFTELIMVENFFEELKRLVPADAQ